MNDVNTIEGLIHLYEDGALRRRDLIRRVLARTGSVAATVAALKGLPAEAQWCPSNINVPENAEDIEAQFLELRGEASPLFVYLVRPRPQSDPLPAVLVIHENRGLNEHIKDVTRRVARYGYVALGIDLLSREGGAHTMADPAEQGRAFGRLTQAGMLADLLTGVAALKDWAFVRPGKIGVVGFCAGGANTWTLAVNSPDVGAAVPFYGTPPTTEQLARVTAPVLAIYAETDRNLTMRMAPVMTAMLEQRKTLGFFVYEGVGHAFHNDTGPAYNRAAACDAWARTIAFFDKHLKPANVQMA
jgi:carboxymethylenebutenolidase